MRPVVAGRDRVHTAVRLSALLGQLRAGLRLEPGRKLSHLPGAAVRVDPGGPVLLPGQRVAGRERGGEGPDPGAAGEGGAEALERHGRPEPSVDSHQRRYGVCGRWYQLEGEQGEAAPPGAEDAWCNSTVSLTDDRCGALLCGMCL